MCFEKYKKRVLEENINWAGERVMPPRCICFMFCQSLFSGLIGILVQAQAPILWGFLDAWTKFLSTVRDWIGSIVGTLIFKVNVSPNMHFGLTPTCIEKMGGRTQEVTVARYGPILWENGATESRKLSIDDPSSTPPPFSTADHPCAGSRKDADNSAEGFH